jgi:2-polyprenyl-6-methoxyphenol hydroxylase-like FAD-dependent oxidoreductase
MPEIKDRTQVIITGAGPTGLSLAAQLIRYGIDFVILEKNEETTPLSKAIAVQARTLEILQEMGLAEKAIQEGRITTALNLFYRARQRARASISGLGEGLSPFPYALSLEQCKTEKLFAGYLTQHGRKILWKSAFSRFEQNEKEVIVYYTDATGKEQSIIGEYLVGCDGAGSLIRHQMGARFEGDTVPKLFYVADVKIKSPVINTDELFIFLIDKGFILFFPMEGQGHYRIVGILPEAGETDKQFQFSDLEPSIKQEVGSELVFEELNWFSSYRVHSRMADTFMNGRCFIAGDAAHIHTPAGGQGMNTGIQDAYNLAWKIAGVIGAELRPEVLKTYNSERMNNARHLLRTTDRMFDIMSGANRFWNFIRLAVFPALAGFITKSSFVRKKIFPMISQTGITYLPDRLVLASRVAKVKAGIRMPHFVLPDGKQIFDCLTRPLFKLLFFGTNAGKNPGNGFKPGVEYMSFTEIPVHLFGGEKDFYILLRPDNHIAYIGKDLNACRELLAGISV